MIVDKLSEAEKYFPLHPEFKIAFEYLRKLISQEIEIGKYEIDGDDIFCIVSSDLGKKKEDAKLEHHKKYIDIQMLIEGNEIIGWKNLSECKSVSKEFNIEKDIAFFNDEPEIWLNLKPLTFAIFFPEDAHAPMISNSVVKKVVVKIKK